MINPYKGSTFDSFLKEEDILEEAEAVAIKRIIVFALQQAMQKQHLTKTEMAEKMHTSRAAIKRLLDPTNTSITLHTLVKVMHLVDKKLRISFK